MKAIEIMGFDDDHEWWQSNTPDAIEKSYESLIEKGFSDLHAKLLIRDIVFAIQAEYGE